MPPPKYLDWLRHCTLSSRRKQQNVEINTKDANFEERESVGGSREKESRYGNKMEANRETTSGACTNTMDIDINLEPGAGGSDKYVGSKNKADSATEIPKTSSESMKVVQDKFENTSAGLDIGFLAAEFPSQSDTENYVTRGHIDLFRR